MATHLLIPISDHRFKSLEDFMNVFPNAKQISLSENDINDKAESYCESGIRAGWGSRKEGYKQALKDLLK